MKFLKPVKLRNRLSLYSILALIGLVAFASIVLAANPFAVRASGGSNIPAASASSPRTGAGSQSAQQNGSGAQNSLLTGAPSPSQAGGGGFGDSGEYHHSHRTGTGSTSVAGNLTAPPSFDN